MKLLLQQAGGRAKTHFPLRKPSVPFSALLSVKYTLHCYANHLRIRHRCLQTDSPFSHWLPKKIHATHLAASGSSRDTDWSNYSGCPKGA